MSKRELIKLILATGKWQGADDFVDTCTDEELEDILQVPYTASLNDILALILTAAHCEEFK